VNRSYDPKIHHRRSIRLPKYDYSQPGFYFITLCTQNRLHLFGEISDDIMVLNDAGKMIHRIWNEIPIHYKPFAIHNFVVMPNHIHGILEITSITGPRACPDSANNTCPNSLTQTQPDTTTPDGSNIGDYNTGGYNTEKGQPRGGAPTGPTTNPATPRTTQLSDIVGRYKSLTTKIYINGIHHHGWQPFNTRVWQRNYWEHIIRNENEYLKIVQYIIENPAKWAGDTLNGGAGNKVLESYAPYNHEPWMI